MTRSAVLSKREAGAEWCWTSLMELNAYDKCPTLTQEERTALQALAESRRRWGDDGPEDGQQIQAAFRRLLEPLEDALAVIPGNRSNDDYKDMAAAALLRACQREQCAFWGWSQETWRRILGSTQAQFFRENRLLVDGSGRQYMIAAAYLLDCFRQVRLLGNFDRVALARKVFGDEAVEAALQPVQEALSGWGYAAAQNTALMSTVCEALLLNQSPYLHDLTAEDLEVFRCGCSESRRALLYQLSKALAALGFLDQPLGIAGPNPAADTGQQAAQDDIHPEWVRWVQRWESASTLAQTTRRCMRTALLKAGRWLQACHPEVTSPAQWGRELAASYVAAVDRMRAGDYVGPRANGPMHERQPLSPRAKDTYLSALRVFFADCQVWGWIPRSFDPWHAFATPRSVKALIGPAPRTIASDIWARLLWAGLNLTAQDLSCTKSYPLEFVRALAIVWLFAGLRSDEIVRLRVGCIRWQAADVTIRGTGETLPRDAVCLLDVPVNKTGAAFTKPVDPVVGEAIAAWEQVRPAQPRFPDRKTGEPVHFVFCYRARPLRPEYINRRLIPMLCRKADVPMADARGPITSHRARATIASQLFNARKPMSLSELQAWLGHRSPATTQNYVALEPTRLAKAYAEAGYLARNVRAIEVLIDQDAVKSSAAAAGQPWRYYDLGHGLCSYEFFEQCPHRMACPRCDFYQPRESSLGHLLEAQSNLLRLLQEMPLTKEERAAVDGDLVALNRLIARLADQPTPSGQTPTELRQCAACPC
ncbi:MAG TPA: site-specific integrase [Anaerolineae bacterium]|nr:site-specific integrase [Anaerolineae bacterium]